MSIESISFHFVLLIRPQKLFQTISGLGAELNNLFSVCLQIGLSQICLWISITLKWIFGEAVQQNMPIIY